MISPNILKFNVDVHSDLSSRNDFESNFMKALTLIVGHDIDSGMNMFSTSFQLLEGLDSYNNEIGIKI